jgi:tRNA-splicing ligase RtcB
MSKEFTLQDFIKINDYTYEIPISYRSDMRVPARVFMNEALFHDIKADRSLDQLVNMTTLPGIQQCAFAMPDIHQGYGFPIGGVAGLAINEGGVISPGGIGYDINCGVRLLAASINAIDIKRHLNKLAKCIFHKVPSGVGQGGRLNFNQHELDLILRNGASYMVQLGFGTEADLALCEENGRMDTADPGKISDQAKNRGRDQIGTLGSGNHFLEIQYVDRVYDHAIAHAYGIWEGQVTVMIHCGSRGLGHQTCTDYVKIMMSRLHDWGYQLPDRELVYAPFESPEAQDYFAAMSSAANYAWANRHMIGHWVREAFIEILGNEVRVNTVYDVSHNIGKIEQHDVNGVMKSLIMHRKGATRAFGPGRPEIVQAYRVVGQPVLIPGTMGTASYVLAGTNASMQVAFGSSCHGAGRKLSRIAAQKKVHGQQLRGELESKGIIIQSTSNRGLAEEAPVAYKDIDQVIDVVSGAGLAHKVARLKPLAVIKGD